MMIYYIKTNNHLHAEPNSRRRRSAATAFGAPRNELGGGGHLGSAAAAWLGGVFVWFQVHP